MKKILILIVLSLGYLLGYSQFPITQNLGSPKTKVVNKGIFYSDSAIIVTGYTDTTQANLGYIKYIPHVIIATSNDIWIRNVATTAWLQLVNIGSGATDTLAWRLSGNNATGMGVTPVMGTISYTDFNFATNNLKRFGVSKDGIQDSTVNVVHLGIDTTTGYLSYARAGGGGGSGGGIVSLGTTGNLCLTRINDSTYAVDTACLAALYLRRADSAGYYVTPTRLQDTSTVLRSLIGAKRDSARQHYIGPIVNQNDWPSLTGYTVNGANAAASGGKIVFSEATNDCFQTVDYDYVTAGDYWSIGGRFTLLKSTGIFSVGIRPLTPGFDVMARIIASSGYIDFIGGCGGTFKRCDSNMTISVGNELEIILERKGATFKLISRNITTGAGPYIVDFTYNTNVDILPTTGKPAIFAFGDGTSDPQFQVDSFYFVNQVITNASFGAKTDSKYAPVRADYNTSTFNLLSENNTMALFTNPNDKMYEFKQGLPEILAANPKQFLIAMGSNDRRTGRSVHDIMVDMDSVYNVLTAAGIDVIVANGTREQVLDLAPLKDSINAHYGSNVLNTWDISFTPGFISSDSIHISNYGQYLLNNLIKNSGLLNFPDYQLRDVSNKYIFNSGTVPQNAAYNITGASTLSSSLSVGNTTVAVPLTVIHSVGQQQLFGSGGYNYTRGLNAAGSAWIPEKRVFTNYLFNTNVASSEYEGLSIARDVNRFGGALVIGNQYDLSTAEALGINPGNGSYLSYFNNAGTNYMQFINGSGGNTGTPLNMRASTYSFNNINAGAVTNLLTLASTGSAKLSQYGIGTFTGTPAYTLQVDASGNIIEGSATPSVSLSSLTAATGSNTINNANNAQNWQWNSLTGGIAMWLSSNSTAKTGSATLFTSSVSGALATGSISTYAASFSNTHTGTSLSNIAGRFSSSGGTTNTAGYFDAAGSATTNIAGNFVSTGATNNYAIIVPASSGSVGIGNPAPTSLLHVSGSFSTGYVAKTANYTATIDDHTINCTANTFQVTLPTAVGIAGRLYVITNSGAGTITVGTTSSETFANVVATPTTLTMAAVGSRTVQSDGANWLLLSSL